MEDIKKDLIAELNGVDVGSLTYKEAVELVSELKKMIFEIYELKTPVLDKLSQVGVKFNIPIYIPGEEDYDGNGKSLILKDTPLFEYVKKCMSDWYSEGDWISSSETC